MINGITEQIKIHNFSLLLFTALIFKRTFFNPCRILIMFFLLSGCILDGQEYNFKSFSTAEGLVQPYVYSITQDAQGYLWIGTGDGLSQYNGFNFTNYTTRDSLADNFVCNSITDDISIWLGHWNGRVSYYDGKKFHPVNYHGRILSRVTHFAKSPDGHMWMSTLSDGLFMLDKDKIIFESNITIEEQINYFDFLNDHELLIGSGSGLIHCRLNEKNEIDQNVKVTEIPESKITGLQKIRNRPGYYIATENDGIFRLVYDNNTFDVTKVKTALSLNLTGIQYIHEDTQANLWLASFGNGLIKIAPDSTGEGIVTVFNKVKGFSTDNVKTVFEDREGIIWSGNAGEGITKITPRPFSINTYDRDLYGNIIFSACLNHQQMWLGTEKGMIKTDFQTGKTIKFFGNGNGLPKDSVTSIYSSDGKELWIGTAKNGLFRMNPENEKIIKFPLGNGLLENSVTGITGKKDQVWITTKKGICNINSITNSLKWYYINHINSSYSDRKDRIWICTNSPILTYIQDEKVHKIPLNNGSGILALGQVTEDSDSRIWVGSKGEGVFIIGSDSIINLTTKEGLLSNDCYSLYCDDTNNNIWVSHKGGFTRIRTNDLSVKQIRPAVNILADCEFYPGAIVKDQNGKIWFGSDKGLISYDQSRELPESEAPVLGITSIKFNNAEKDITDDIIHLSPGSYKIQISFIGISLKDPDVVTYQYKLEGYNQWSEITKKTSVTFNNISEGDYTFILKASSGDGAVTKEPVKLSFIIKKPVWKTWWFYTGTILFVTFIIYLYIKVRLNRLMVDKSILEKKVLERTNDILLQKDEIEKQRNLIEHKNFSITSSITYASYIQNAILPPGELLTKLLPDSFILSRPKDIVSGDFYWLTEKDSKVIFAVADCTGHGVPGAFMSLLGMTLLNEIVNIHGITASDVIITVLRQRIVQSLQQNRKDSTTRDGMDIALCVMDPQQNKLYYTGGMIDLVQVRDGRLNIIRADRLDVSASSSERGDFIEKEIDYKKGDLLYLFSDGYEDQFGGEHNRKFLRCQFYKILLEIHSMPMSIQKEFLEKKLIEWMKDETQTDDITVLGIRL